MCDNSDDDTDCSWLSPTEATVLIQTNVQDEYEAREILLTWLKTEQVLARADQAVGSFDGKGVNSREWEIPTKFWGQLLEPTNNKWRCGIFSNDPNRDLGHDIRRARHWRPLDLTGVKFARQNLLLLVEELSIPSPPQPADLTNAKARGGRPAAIWWPDFAEELAMYVHEAGFPDGKMHEGQSAIIDAVAARLVERGKDEPSRSQVQPVINNILDRIRSAGN